MDIHKKNRYASYDLRRKIEMQHEEFQKMTEREQVPLLKSLEYIETEQVHCCIVFSLNIESRCPCATIPFVSFIIAHFP